MKPVKRPRTSRPSFECPLCYHVSTGPAGKRFKDRFLVTCSGCNEPLVVSLEPLAIYLARTRKPGKS